MAILLSDIVSCFTVICFYAPVASPDKQFFDYPSIPRDSCHMKGCHPKFPLLFIKICSE